MAYHFDQVQRVLIRWVSGFFSHKGMSFAQEFFFSESDYIWTTVKLSLSAQSYLAGHSEVMLCSQIGLVCSLFKMILMDGFIVA